MKLPSDAVRPRPEASESVDLEGVAEDLELDDTPEIPPLGEDDLAGSTAPPGRREARTASASGGSLPARGLARLHAKPRSRLPEPPAPRMETMLQHDVEMRTLSGGCYRGKLIAVTRDYALLERRTGRLALIRLAAVAAACDENFPGGT